MTTLLRDNSNKCSRASTMAIHNRKAWYQQQGPEQLWEDVMNGDFSIIDSSNSSSSSLETEDLPLTAGALSLGKRQAGNIYGQERKANHLFYERPRNYGYEQPVYQRQQDVEEVPFYGRRTPCTPKPARAHYLYDRPPSPYPRYQQHQEYQYSYEPVSHRPNEYRQQYVRQRQNATAQVPATTPMRQVQKRSTGNRRFIRRQSIDKYDRNELYISSEDQLKEFKLFLFFVTIGLLYFGFFR